MKTSFAGVPINGATLEQIDFIIRSTTKEQATHIILSDADSANGLGNMELIPIKEVQEIFVDAEGDWYVNTRLANFEAYDIMFLGLK